MSIRVLKPGLLSSVQDGGRFGQASIGVGRAGAMDAPAWRLANALVGNGADAAAIECTLLGPTLRFEQAAWIALCGAPMTARIDQISLPAWTTCRIPAGSVLHIGGARIGCRAYLAVHGGIDVAPVLGSRSSDLHAGIGPGHGRALKAGDVLPVGASHPLPDQRGDDRPRALRWGLDPQPWFDFAHEPIALLDGSHTHQLESTSRQRLFETRFRISPDSNRTASRLDGQTLKLTAPLELISEATLPGTVQLPSSGQPIVLLADAPVTGGYPRIGQVAAVDLARLAQRRPGDTLRFVHCTLENALTRLIECERQLEQLTRQIARRLQPPG